MIPANLAALPTDELEALAADLLAELARDRRENALDYYVPVNPAAEPVHYSPAREIGLVGGHRSSKSDTMLAEIAIQMTGVVPRSLAARYPTQKIRPPIRARLFCTSFQNSFEPQIKKKLQWTEWDGPGAAGSDRGHYGWIPRRFLLHGSWEQSWSEKNRLLRLTNGSTLQVLSYEQDLDDVKVGSFHVIGEDELGPEKFHRQNRMRVMETQGQIFTAATPPDDRSAAVTAAWFHDRVYVPGLGGANPDVFCVVLETARNRLLRPEDIEWLGRGLTEEQCAAQLGGAFLHLAGLVFPEFAEGPRTWCFGCELAILPLGETCPRCGGSNLTAFAHVVDDLELPDWPVLFYGDPHPRRPLAGLWVKVDPNDDWWIVDEIEIDPCGGPATVRRRIEDHEAATGLDARLVWRKLDSKMTVQKNEYAGEAWTIGKALRDAGLDFEDANVSKETGYANLRDAMRVNPWTRQPRLHILRRCRRTIYQLTHFVWDEHARRTDRDVKEIEKDANSDFPACLRFMANDNLTWESITNLVLRPKVTYVQGVARNRSTGY